jgi:sugar phosphate isomerase/epimerase
MFDVAISQLTTLRWDLSQELSHLTAGGFDAISVWRPKLSDAGLGAAAASLACAGVRVSSLQWAGGFAGGDGRSFGESIEDAIEAIDAAALLAAPVLVVHAGCRGGHTRAHATRLLVEAIETLAPIARRAGVVLGLKAVRAAAVPGCGLLTCVGEAIELVERFNDPAIRLALDLWQFGDEDLSVTLPRLAAAAAVVQVADRCGPVSADSDRMPVGHGALPLETIVAGLVEHGYRGDFEFDPVGERVEALGYESVLGETRRLANAWRDRLALDHPDHGFAAARGIEPAHVQLRGVHFRPAAGAAAGSRRSQASSQTVSRG